MQAVLFFIHFSCRVILEPSLVWEAGTAGTLITEVREDHGPRRASMTTCQAGLKNYGPFSVLPQSTTGTKKKTDIELYTDTETKIYCR